MDASKIIPGDLTYENGDAITKSLREFFGERNFVICTSKAGSHQKPNITTGHIVQNVETVYGPADQSVMILITTQMRDFHVTACSKRGLHVTFDIDDGCLTIVAWSATFKAYTIFSV